MNQQWWKDLVFEGEKLTAAVEGASRDLSLDIEPTAEGRARVRVDAERYRAGYPDTPPRYPDNPVHQLQDVIDAYRWNHPEVNRKVRRGIGFERPGR